MSHCGREEGKPTIPSFAASLSLHATAGFVKMEPSGALTAAMADVKDCFHRLFTLRWLQRNFCQVIDGVALHASTIVHPCCVCDPRASVKSKTRSFSVLKILRVNVL